MAFSAAFAATLDLLSGLECQVKFGAAPTECFHAVGCDEAVEVVQGAKLFIGVAYPGKAMLAQIGAPGLAGLIIFLFTLAPFLPMDAASIVAGAIRYPFLRYLLVMGLAHTIKMVAITWLVANSGTDFLNWIPGVG